MIKFRVYSVMADREFRTNKSLAEATGISENNLGKIIKGDIKRLDVDSLNKLCRALDCQPGDLLEYTSDDPAA